MIVLEPYVQLEEVFAECFLTSPRTTCYSTLFSSRREEWCKSIHPDGNLLAILQDVSTVVVRGSEGGREGGKEKRGWEREG